MSVLIKGMQMPSWCFECPLALSPEDDDDSFWTCRANGMKVHEANTEEHRPYGCPLAEVTEGMRHGRWKRVDKGNYFYDWECSVCGGSGRGDYLICPWCGAKMDEVGDE